MTNRKFWEVYQTPETPVTPFAPRPIESDERPVNVPLLIAGLILAAAMFAYFGYRAEYAYQNNGNSPTAWGQAK